MRSNANGSPGIHVQDPISNFLFGALLAALVMMLTAASLSVHAFQTRRWLAQVKAEAAARQSPVSLTRAAGLKTDGCPDTKPVLTGFDADGKPQCRALGFKSCGDGEYIESIDPVTLSVKCAVAGGEISCPETSYIAEFMWLGETRTSFSCGQRLNPFLAWKFEPVLGPKGNE